MNKAVMIAVFLLAFAIFLRPVRADSVAWNNTLTLLNFSFGKEFRGIMITTNTTFNITNISSQSDSPQFRYCMLFDNAKTLIVNNSFTGRNCTIGQTLSSGTNYYIVVMGQDNGAINDWHQYASATFPYQYAFGQVVAGAIDTAGVWTNQTAPAQLFDIKFIYYAIAGPTYTVNLYLNNTQNNVSMQYANATNLTMTTNDTTGYIWLNNTNVGNVTKVFGVNYYAVKANSTNNITGVTYYLNITQAVPSCTLSLIPASPVIYNATFKPVCSCSETEGTANLYKNNTLDNTENNTNALLGAGTYTYACNITGTQNYTNASASSNMVIQQTAPNQTLSFNTSATVTLGTPVNVSCASNNSINATLFNTGVFFNYSWGIYPSYVAGYYNFSCNATNGNYTNATVWSVLVVYPPNINGNASIVYDLAKLTPNNQTCLNNMTLYQIYSEANINRSIYCPYGCDNVSFACSPPAWQADMLTAGLIIGFLLIVGVFAWWML